MDFVTNLPLLTGASTPTIANQTIAMHLGWALVLGAMAAFMLRPFALSLRLTGVGLVMLSCLPNTEWSPAWWLGLAFQTPSLTLQGIGLLYLIRMWRIKGLPTPETVNTTVYARWPNSLLLIAIVTGWIFALDTFATFDLQLYAIGFTPYAVLASLVLAGVMQLISMAGSDGRASQRYHEMAWVILGAVAIHLLTRLPTGNAWDALMDPWLWLIAQALWLSRAIGWLALLARAKARKAGELISTAIGRVR